ncbi:MAG TPA: hypothetical protein VGL09_15855 [Methylomirabilota bacterium]
MSGLRHCLPATLAIGLVLSSLGEGAHLVALPPDVPPAERGRLEEIAESAAVSTQVHAEPFVARREIFEYLLDHPEFASHVVRTLRLARYRVWRTADGFFLDDGWGAKGRFSVVSATRRQDGSGGSRVMYAQGRYDPAMFPSIKGQAVVLLDYGVEPDTGGKSKITTAVSGYVKLDSRVLTAAGKAAGPVARAKADLEAHRLVKVFAKTTRAVEADPAGVCAHLRDNPEISRAQLDEFRRLLNLP